MSGQSGKGNSSAQTTNQVSNQQVATTSGIALGAGATGNEINVSSSDPKVAAAAIAGNSQVAGEALGSNVAVTSDALNFAGHAADVAAQTNQFATQAVENIAGGSLQLQDNLATKFTGAVSDLAAQNINLLQSVGQQQTDVALNAQNAAKDALDQSFAVSESVAPQDPNYATESLAGTQSQTIVYIVLGILAILGLGFVFLRRKS